MFMLNDGKALKDATIEDILAELQIINEELSYSKPDRPMLPSKSKMLHSYSMMLLKELSKRTQQS